MPEKAGVGYGELALEGEGMIPVFKLAIIGRRLAAVDVGGRRVVAVEDNGVIEVLR